MKTRLLAAAMLALAIPALAVVGCHSEATSPVAPAGPGPDEALHRPPGGRFCGGIGGFQCPPGYVCEDDPSDDCDPRRGGADCGGICLEDDVDEDDCRYPVRRYVSRSRRQCAAVLFMCADGLLPFFDRTGCGCEGCPTYGDSMDCGPSRCRPGQFCCNESCGICAPLGGACTQQVCE